ncbi:hypothetical protein NYO91_07565 [Arhodomonas aquaeolei]|uniref:hypothetical protein n=1 Tax=Arhodomonas aquaeolei TaxID=2369 RepID=UPI00216A3921|nr:hypothetical protein [Arhodomonas aquaeolei]MCS4503932.1 hypothetical protein [Arhodomonas aquaeolei]
MRQRIVPLAILAAAVALPALAAAVPRPVPGRWVSVARLEAIGITQRHEGVLSARWCQSGFVFAPQGKPPATFTLDPDAGVYTATTKADSCVTHWRLSPGQRRLEGTYTGQCQGMSMEARVTMRLLEASGSVESAPPKRGGGADGRAGGAGGDISGGRALGVVASALTAVGAATDPGAFGDYLWSEVKQGSRHVSMWLTADRQPRRAARSMPDPCDVAPGSLEGARYLLDFEIYRLGGDGTHMAVARVVDVETGRILQQRMGEGGRGRDGAVAAVGGAYDALDLGITVPAKR